MGLARKESAPTHLKVHFPYRMKLPRHVITILLAAIVIFLGFVLFSMRPTGESGKKAALLHSHTRLG
jgi:hypothetical protein